MGSILRVSMVLCVSVFRCFYTAFNGLIFYPVKQYRVLGILIAFYIIVVVSLLNSYCALITHIAPRESTSRPVTTYSTSCKMFYRVNIYRVNTTPLPPPFPLFFLPPFLSSPGFLKTFPKPSPAKISL